MQDQVTNLKSKGIKTTFLGSAQLDRFEESKTFCEDGEQLVFVTGCVNLKSCNG